MEKGVQGRSSSCLTSCKLGWRLTLMPSHQALMVNAFSLVLQVAFSINVAREPIIYTIRMERNVGFCKLGEEEGQYYGCFFSSYNVS